MFSFSQNHEHEEKLHRRHLERDVDYSDLDAVDSDEDSDNYYDQSDKHNLAGKQYCLLKSHSHKGSTIWIPYKQNQPRNNPLVGSKRHQHGQGDRAERVANVSPIPREEEKPKRNSTASTTSYTTYKKATSEVLQGSADTTAKETAKKTPVVRKQASGKSRFPARVQPPHSLTVGSVKPKPRSQPEDLEEEIPSYKKPTPKPTNKRETAAVISKTKTITTPPNSATTTTTSDAKAKGIEKERRSSKTKHVATTKGNDSEKRPSKTTNHANHRLVTGRVVNVEARCASNCCRSCTKSSTCKQQGGNLKCSTCGERQTKLVGRYEAEVTLDTADGKVVKSLYHREMHTFFRANGDNISDHRSKAGYKSYFEALKTMSLELDANNYVIKISK